jgi:ACS family hexuronate transporter-like MFS transporter
MRIAPSTTEVAPLAPARWQVVTLVSAAIALSYLDRQTLPVAIKAISVEIPVSNQQFSLLQTAFLLTYALMYAGGGRLMDRLGTQRGFGIIMIAWSLACAGHGLAGSFVTLAIFRLLLGAGEGGGFPAATRAVAEWFPVRERSTAMGIINAGTAAGMILAPPLIALILSVAHWRWIFFCSGALGLAWTLAWNSFFRRRTAASRGALTSLPEGGSGPEHTEPSVQGETTRALRWMELLRYRETCGIVLAKFLTDAAWFFYLFWLPKYLYDARGFDIKAVGTFGWIPPVAAGVGCLASGACSSWLIARQHSVNRARKLVMGASALLMPLILFVPTVATSWALALFCLAYFGHQAWSTLVMILPTDLFPKSSVGTIAGLVGCGGALGGVAFGQLVGYLLDHGFGWGTVFAIAGSLHWIGFAVICLTVPTIGPLLVPGEAPPATAQAQVAETGV